MTVPHSTYALYVCVRSAHDSTRKSDLSMEEDPDMEEDPPRLGEDHPSNPDSQCRKIYARLHLQIRLYQNRPSEMNETAVSLSASVIVIYHFISIALCCSAGLFVAAFRRHKHKHFSIVPVRRPCRG